ncbi:MAG TPA: ABC transporter permease subunit, partial [Candidatus Izemoplasmatales bacterium]|nr:ABC transporter permease subunit [Candidatus Izemoplasmatales bacterium]
MKHYIMSEFKRQFKTLIIWTILILGLSILMLSMFPAFNESLSDLESLLGDMPPGFLEVFGLGDGGLDITSPYGWYGMEGYLFVILLGGSYAGVIGSTILSKEEDDQTIEFLLSKPISRNQILLGKGLVIVINLLLMNVLLFFTLTIMFSIIGDLQMGIITLFAVGSLMLQVIFASISYALSVFMTKSRKVMSAALGLVVGLFFLDIIATLTDQLNFLKYLTPYEYVNAVSIVNE